MYILPPEMADDGVAIPFATDGRTVAQAAYDLQVARLWPWRGWIAVFIRRELVGVYPTRGAAAEVAVPAILAGLPVYCGRIGGNFAAPVPLADGPPA